MSEVSDFLPDAAEVADVSNLLNELNDAQRQAVTAPPEHMLILAGAGSGKTRVRPTISLLLPLPIKRLLKCDSGSNSCRGRR